MLTAATGTCPPHGPPGRPLGALNAMTPAKWQDDRSDEFEPDLVDQLDDLDDDALESDDDLPQRRDLDERDSDGTVRCPSCGCHIWARADRCHRCGHLMPGEAWQYQTRAERSPLWLYAALAVVAAILLGFLAMLWTGLLRL
jgi:hypothetical protein